MRYQDEVNQVIIHELIHAYDECRAANLEWSNCAHHACSEVRALKSRLYTDSCTFWAVFDYSKWILCNCYYRSELAILAVIAITNGNYWEVFLRYVAMNKWVLLIIRVCSYNFLCRVVFCSTSVMELHLRAHWKHPCPQLNCLLSWKESRSSFELVSFTLWSKLDKKKFSSFYPSGWPSGLGLGLPCWRSQV